MARRPPGTCPGLTVWFTGLSCSGKSTISLAVREELSARGYRVEWLDGDIVRQRFSQSLGFTKPDREENIRRIGLMAEEFAQTGAIVLVAAVSPYRSMRDQVRSQLGNFLEVYVHAPLEVCEQRDVKGLYRRARAGEIHHVSGLDDPYEPPSAPEVDCRTDRESIAQSAAKVLLAIESRLS